MKYFSNSIYELKRQLCVSLYVLLYLKEGYRNKKQNPQSIINAYIALTCYMSFLNKNYACLNDQIFNHVIVSLILLTKASRFWYLIFRVSLHIKQHSLLKIWMAFS